MKKHLFTLTAALVLLVMTVFCLSACSKTLTLTVIDSSSKTEIEAKSGMTVSEVLKEAGIVLFDKDETNPPLDEKITEDTKEITVLRYAKIIIVNGSEKTEVELVGGTVSDALKKAGITLADGEETDPKEDTPVKDQMTVTISKEVKVTLTADGTTTEMTTRALDVKSFLEEQKITLSEDDEVSEKLDAKIEDGMKIVVKRVEYKEVTEKEQVDFETKEEYSSSMYQGESQVTQEGVKGEKEVVYKVKYVDSKEVSREKISEKIIKEPVDQIVTVGTQEQATEKQEVSRVQYPNCDDPSHGYYEVTYTDGSTEYEPY